jgi:phage terminase large subunit GpA-like protein
MCARSWPSSPRCTQNFDDASWTIFEGADDLGQVWRDGLRPDPLLTVSEWADAHRYLSPRASAEPGRYRTDRTPYMRAIMDALSPSHPARRIVVMKSAQVGFTEGGNCWIGYVIHHAPGPMLAVQPTVELAKRFSRQRIEPLIAESPVLRERVRPSRARDAGNTVLSKEFPAGLLIITGANSAVGLRSIPARYLFLDEVDAYPPSATRKAIRLHSPKRAPAPSRGVRRFCSVRRRQSKGFPGLSANTRRLTSAATSTWWRSQAAS